MAKRTKKIGVFDSGFGGLHVLRSVVGALPQYDYIYLGDTARTPYGDRTQETIYRYTKQAVDFLFDQGCGLVIIACNTASSEALRRIQDTYGAKKKVLGVLIPAAEEAVEKTAGRVGVIATRGTVASQKFVRELRKLDPLVRVYQEACPLLVPIIENGEQNEPETVAVLKRYLRPLLRRKIDTLILGCTHYGIIENKIRDIVGEKVALVSEAKVVPKKLRAYLRKHTEIETTLSKRGSMRFFSTDKTDKFKTIGSALFGKELKVEKAILE